MKKLFSTVALAAILSFSASNVLAGDGVISNDLTENDKKGVISNDFTGTDGKGLIVSDLINALIGLIVSD